MGILNKYLFFTGNTIKRVHRGLGKRRNDEKDDIPCVKEVQLEYSIPSVSSRPALEVMGIAAPMKLIPSRIPNNYKLGNLAEEKFAGIVSADLYDIYDIQIYCRLFEHFSYYPVFNFVEEIWIPAHVHAMNEVIRLRTAPAELMRRARLDPNVYH